MLPLSLYIHFPWCVRKCPYCDFSSFPAPNQLPEQEYLAALLADLANDLELVKGREISSIFLGGGTPSLFSPRTIAELLEKISSSIKVVADAEISMEINPGTITGEDLRLLKAAGINRLSIGVQSFQDEKLQVLGRIHDAEQAHDTVLAAQDAGFENFNLDLMYGLPRQTVADAIFDLESAIKLQSTHLSWYQLTLEPGTVFGKSPPALLPNEELQWEIQQHGEQLIASAGFEHYEISAYCQPGKFCKHNLNYWQFGDYLGIGAGAHGKITIEAKKIMRTEKAKIPWEYMDSAVKPRNDKVAEAPSYRGLTAVSTKQELISEFMLNALRLLQPIPLKLFTARTGLGLKLIEVQLAKAEEKGLLQIKDEQIITTDLGRRFLNQLIAMF